MRKVDFTSRIYGSNSQGRVMSNFQGIRVALRLMAAAGFSLLVAFGALAQTVRYIHTDGVGSVVLVTDKDRNIVERSEYEPYGSLLNRPIKDGPAYTGHVVDAATGLTYMQQRYYESDIGTFLSVDPVAVRGSGDNYNRYAYAGNNPYKFNDPDGRELGIAFKVVNEATNGGPIEPPPRSPDDWLGPAIGGALAVVMAPAMVFGGYEAGMAALANPVAANAIGSGIAEAIAGTSLGVGSGLGATAAASGKGVTATAEGIRDALAGSNMMTTQRAISLPMVQRYVDKIAEGSVAPAIKVADNVIVDGNHRYVAGRIMGQEPAMQPGTLSPSFIDRTIPVQEMKVDHVDWGGQ